MPDPFVDGDGEVSRAEHISPRKTGDNIQAKRTANYVWDGSNWQRMTQPGSSTTTLYKTLIDKTTTTNVIYIGEAAIGTATNAASWLITKVDKTSSPISITYAAAGASTATWNNRATTEVYT